MSDWSPHVGAQVGNYRLLAPLAEGGMATLYVALEEGASIRRLVALKFVRPHLLSNEDMRAMFSDEVTISSQLSSPHVIRVLDTGTHRDVPFLAMEFLRGESLAALLKATRDARPAPTLWLSALAQVARGLHAAHTARDVSGNALGIVHRDINPRNIHVGDAGHVTLLDFGVASANVREARTRTGELKGTVSYLAPEQLQGGLPLDHRVDLWALGVVAYECLSGERLFRGSSEGRTMWNIMNLEPKPLPERIDESVRRTIEACLERNPTERPKSAEQVAVIFEQAAHRAGETQDRLRALMGLHFGEKRKMQEATLKAEIDADVASARAPEASFNNEQRPQSKPSSTDGLPKRWLAVGVAAALSVGASAWWLGTSARAPFPEERAVSSGPARPEAVVEPAEAPTQKLEEPSPSPSLDEPMEHAHTIEAPPRPRMRASMTPRRTGRRHAPTKATSMERYIEEAPY